MSDHNEVSLAIRVDSAIAHFSRKSLYWLGVIALGMAGIAGIALLPISIFEYGEGRYDISTHEWLLLTLLALLVWRYWTHCIAFQVAWSTRISRILISLGAFFVLETVLSLTLVLLGLAAGEGLHSVLNEPVLLRISEAIFWSGTCLALYLASPPPHTQSRKKVGADDIPVL